MITTDNFSYDTEVQYELSKVKLGFIAIFVPQGVAYLEDNTREQLLKRVVTHVMGRFEIQTIETNVESLCWSIAVRKPSLLDTTQQSYAVVQECHVHDIHDAATFLRNQLFDILPTNDELITFYEYILPAPPITNACIESDWDDEPVRFRAINPIETSCCSGIEPEKKPSIRKRMLNWLNQEKTDNAPKPLNISERSEISAIEAERRKWLDALQTFTLEYVQRFHEMPPMAEIEQRVRGMMLLPSPKCAELSRIKINGDFHIFLPDYDELELRMTPLVRTLYIFFLLHPEGVALRFIPDYAAELTRIYSYVKPGADEDLARRSIESLIDPFSESLQQKLSMSRRAIREQIPIPEIAKHYMITGTPGGVYRINIDTGLVDLPKFLINS